MDLNDFERKLRDIGLPRPSAELDRRVHEQASTAADSDPATARRRRPRPHRRLRPLFIIAAVSGAAAMVAIALILSFTGPMHEGPAEPAATPRPREGVDPTPTGAMTGSVVDAATGRPVDGVAIECRFEDGDEERSMRATTDASGHYALAAPAGRAVRLALTKEGYARTFKGPFVPKKLPWFTIDFALERERGDIPAGRGRITGVVIDAATGKPVADLTVDLCLATGGSKDRMPTDARGRFRFDAGVGGDTRRRIEIEAPGFLEYRSDAVPFEAGRTTHLEIIACPVVTLLKGVVKDSETGQALAGARVELGLGIVGPMKSGVTTGGSGDYVLETAPGYVRIRASLPGYEPGLEEFTLEGGERRTLDFSLKKIGATVAGTCVDANTNRPVEGATVDVFQDSWPAYVARTDRGGTFSIRLPAGDYHVLARKEGYRPEYLDKISVLSAGNAPVSLRLYPTAGSLSGKVVDRDTRQSPAKHVEVYIAGIDPDYGSILGGFLEYPVVEIDRQAKTYRTEVGPGRFRITARSPGYFPYEEEVAVPDQEHRTFDVELVPFPPKTATIKGVLVTDPPATLAHWGVSVYLGTVAMGYVKAAPDGSFEAKVPAGGVRIEARGQSKQGKKWITYRAKAEVQITKGEVSNLRLILKPE
jgi:5-hydroxyisourate hydrolase-like protein (transthyretin family)